ncbi:hypothetical protein [Amycolatopsis sp. NPDC051061]|uniref:hypothetical protein n=1 Tax=Amycolatopsis sp. NPDC051061 TaxID=3155042 RepID=UPI003443CFBD
MDDAVARAGVAERELREEAGRYGTGSAADVVLLAAVHGQFARDSALIARRAAGFVAVGA